MDVAFSSSAPIISVVGGAALGVYSGSPSAPFTVTGGPGLGVYSGASSAVVGLISGTPAIMSVDTRLVVVPISIVVISIGILAGTLSEIRELSSVLSTCT